MTRRLLAVAPWVPGPQRPRSFGHLQVLSRHFEVRVIAAVRHPGDVEQLGAAPVASWRAVNVNPFSGAVRAVAAVPRGRSLQQAYMGSGALRSAVREEMARFQPHVAYFNVIRTAHLVAESTAPFNVIDLDEFRSEYYRQLGSSSSHPVRRLLGRIEHPRLARAEAAVMTTFDRVLVSSEADVRDDGGTLRLVRSAPMESAPDAVLVRSLRAAAGTSPIVLFVGRLSYAANAEGLKWFIHNVLDDLRLRVPDLQLWIVGADPARGIRQMAADAGARIFADVSSTEPFYAVASVAIAPIQLATGVQMKLIESARAGTPAVVTPRVAHLASAGSDDVRVASSPGEWVAHVSEILNDANLRRELGMRARRWYDRNYGGGLIEHQLLDAFVSTEDHGAIARAV